MKDVDCRRNKSNVHQVLGADNETSGRSAPLVLLIRAIGRYPVSQQSTVLPKMQLLQCLFISSTFFRELALESCEVGQQYKRERSRCSHGTGNLFTDQ